MIIPNEFVKDHTLTQKEITSLMTSDLEYGRIITGKYSEISSSRPNLIHRTINSIKSAVRNFAGNDPDKILTLKMRLNKLLHRKLTSKW